MESYTSFAVDKWLHGIVCVILIPLCAKSTVESLELDYQQSKSPATDLLGNRYALALTPDDGFLIVSDSRESRLWACLGSHLRFVLDVALLCIAFVGTISHQIGVLTRELVDLGLRELPRADLVLEEHIELAVCTSFGLWKTEVCPDQQQKARSCPEKSVRS